MLPGLTSAPDPFVLGDIADGLSDISGKTLSSQTIDASVRTCVLLIAGQSNTANSFPTPYCPANAGKIDNLSIYDGAIYKAADPLLGTSGSGGSAWCRLADLLIGSGRYDRVILCPVGIDGTTIAQWQTGGPFGNRIAVALARLAAKALVPTAILWGQGESDHGTSQAVYFAAMSSLVAASRWAGFAGPWLVARQTMCGGGGPGSFGDVSASVHAAQSQIVDPAMAVHAGPNADLLGCDLRQASPLLNCTHFNDAGADAYAAAWCDALLAVL